MSHRNTQTSKRATLNKTAACVAEDTCAGAGQSVSPEERQRLIAMAAYYRAERRGFAPGRELDDWLESEAEIGQRQGPA